MKNVKKLLALLMALVMLFAFCACDNGKDDDKKESKGEKLTAEELEGDWEMTLDLGAMINSGVMGEVPEIFEIMDPDDLDLTLALDVTFEDGMMEADPESVTECFENMLDSMVDWLAKGDNIYEIMAASSDDMTAAECKEYFEENGYSKNDLIDEIQSNIPDADVLFGSAATEFCYCYELDGNKLYTWEEDDEKDDENYFQFTYADEVITVTKVVDDGESTKLDDGDFILEKK